MNKSLELTKIASEIERCRICKKGKSGKAVPGEGNPDADIVFIGEAPGREEAKTGRPFVGRSGQLLRSMIRSIGLQEEDVFITSPVKYLPDRGTPTMEDIKHGRVHLEKQLAVIRPKIIVLLGNTAVKALFDTSIPVLKHHGTFIKKDGQEYMCLLHPAAVIRFPKYRPVFEEDFSKLQSFLKI